MKHKDIPETARIEAECFSVPWSEKGFQDALDGDRNIFLTASSGERENGKIVGYIGMYTAADEGEITNIAVTGNARRSGTGRLLVEEACLAAQKIGVRSIYLEVRVSNDPAIKLYQTCGFELCGIRKKFYSRPQEDAYVMVKRMR